MPTRACLADKFAFMTITRKRESRMKDAVMLKIVFGVIKNVLAADVKKPEQIGSR